MNYFKTLRLSIKLRKYFNFLFVHGFSIQSYRYQSDRMGFWEIILTSQDIGIQIYDDRGETMLSMCSNQNKDGLWFGLGTVVFFVTNGETFIGSFDGDFADQNKQLERLSVILKKYIDEICIVLGRDYQVNKNGLEAAHNKVVNLYRDKFIRSKTADELAQYLPKK
jgi:hypothetical protein